MFVFNIRIPPSIVTLSLMLIAAATPPIVIVPVLPVAIFVFEDPEAFTFTVPSMVVVPPAPPIDVADTPVAFMFVAPTKLTPVIALLPICTVPVEVPEEMFTFPVPVPVLILVV